MLKLAWELPRYCFRLCRGSFVNTLVEVVDVIGRVNLFIFQIFIPELVAEHHRVHGLVVISLEVVNHVLLFAGCQWSHVFVVGKFILLSEDFHQVVVAFVLRCMDVI